MCGSQQKITNAIHAISGFLRQSPSESNIKGINSIKIAKKRITQTTTKHNTSIIKANVVYAIFDYYFKA